MDYTDGIKWSHLYSVLERYGTEFRESLKMNLLNDGSNATGTLANSLRYFVQTENGVISVCIGLEDYWKYVNDGTQPHFPPVSAIRSWIEAKQIVPEVRDGGRLPTVDQLSYLIARKISRVGTQGTGFFDRTAADINSRFLVEIENAVTEDIGEGVDILLLQLKDLK